MSKIKFLSRLPKGVSFVGYSFLGDKMYVGGRYQYLVASGSGLILRSVIKDCSKEG